MERNSSRAISLSDNTEEEEMLSETSDESSSEDEEDEDLQLQADSPPSEPALEAIYTSESSHTSVVKDDQKKPETISVCDQPNASSEVNFSEKPRPATLELVDFERIPRDDPARPSGIKSCLKFGSKERNIGTIVKDSSYMVSADDLEKMLIDVKPTVLSTSTPLATAKYSNPTIKFLGIDIRPELIPTLEIIWGKQGSLIGPDTVRSKKILGSALEELAEVVITLKYTSARLLTDTQAEDLKSKLHDFERQGLKVEWLVPIIDRAIMLHKGKSVIEAVVALDTEIARVEEKEREFLAESAKLKRELKVSRARLCSRASIPEPIEDIDLDDFLGKDLW